MVVTMATMNVGLVRRHSLLANQWCAIACWPTSHAIRLPCVGASSRTFGLPPVKQGVLGADLKCAGL